MLSVVHHMPDGDKDFVVRSEQILWAQNMQRVRIRHESSTLITSLAALRGRSAGRGEGENFLNNRDGGVTTKCIQEGEEI